MRASFPRRLVAEAVGTALLLVAVVGSGIFAERLAGGNVALALLANALATGGALYALLLALGPISGAHLNPAITAVCVGSGAFRKAEGAGYVLVQVFGAFVGVAVAHAMFGLPAFSSSHHVRSGLAQAFAEAVATFGLVLTVLGCGRTRPEATAGAVACYIVGAYWFTASTSFANPAVTLARAVTDTFSGIRPLDVPGFLAGQAVGALCGAALVRWLFPVHPATGEASPS
jgi:glycerol uptake facilitator-like aquaporin